MSLELYRKEFQKESKRIRPFIDFRRSIYKKPKISKISRFYNAKDHYVLFYSKKYYTGLNKLKDEIWPDFIGLRSDTNFGTKIKFISKRLLSL